MPDLVLPSVFIEELPHALPVIAGVSTGTAGILGLTERGPETPQLVTSLFEFERCYGGIVTESYLADAMRGFFDNGGQRCVVSRIVGARAVGFIDEREYYLAGVWARRVGQPSA